MDNVVATKVVQVVVEASTNKASFTEANATARGYLTGLPSGLISSGGVGGVGGISGGGITSAEMLTQQQQARERSLAQLLAARGITASPGISRLAAKDLSALGLTQQELSGLGIGAGGITRAGEQMGWGTRSAVEKLPGMGGLGSVMGFGAGTLALGGAAIALTELLKLSGDLTKTYQDEQHAARDLKSAYDDMNVPFAKYSTQIDQFIIKNARYIDDQAAVREGYATLTRAGIDQTNVQLAINDALDMSGNTGKSFTDSLTLILGGLEGNTRGLKLMGVNVKDYGDLTDSSTHRTTELTAAQKGVAAATEAYTNAQRAVVEQQQRMHDKYTVTTNDTMHLQDLQDKAKDAADKLAAANANLAKVTNDGNSVVQHRTDLLTTVKTKNLDGRDSTDALKQSSNDLHAAWNQLAQTSGPGLIAIQKAWDQELQNDLSDLNKLVGRLGDLGDVIRTLASNGNPSGSTIGYTIQPGGRGYQPGADPTVPGAGQGAYAGGLVPPRPDGEAQKQTKLLGDIKTILKTGGWSVSGNSASHRTG